MKLVPLPICLLLGVISVWHPRSVEPAIASSFHITVVASPAQVQVGHYVTVYVRASSGWGNKSSVSVRLSSPHHFINIAASWLAKCPCFSVRIRLIPRVHPPEVARITVTASVSGSTYTGRASAKIYGLYPNGKPEPIPTPKKLPKNYLKVSGWVYPKEPVAARYSTLWVQTLPGSTCSARVTFEGGKTPAHFDGSPTETDGMGQANWTWFNNISASTTGTATIQCDREVLHGQTVIQFRVRG